MLINSFYTASNFQPSENGLTATILFDKDHDIFRGHFPGTPVVPGVCMMQLVKEMLQQLTAVKSRISTASQVKFLTMITPLETPQVQLKLTYKITDAGYDVQAELHNDATSFFKFKGVLTKEA